MFTLLSFLSLVFCLVCGAALTSDTVSSEKREGTLGLLFLTPLRSMDIILGKLVCQSLLATYGLLAVFPMLWLPLVLGGVTWAEVARVELALAVTLGVSIAVGMVFSVFGTDSRATFMGTLWTVLLLAGVPMLVGLFLRTFANAGRLASHLEVVSPIATLLAGFASRYNVPGTGTAYLATPAGRVVVTTTLMSGSTAYWASVGALFVCTLLLIMLATLMLPRVLSRVSVPGPASAITGLSQSRSSVLLANPYHWRLLHSAGPMPMRIGVVALLLFFGVALVGSANPLYWNSAFACAVFSATALHVMVKIGFALEATKPVQADRQSGALELLLVTPLSSAQIELGYHGAMRRASRWQAFLLLGINSTLELAVLRFRDHLHMDPRSIVMFSVFFLGGIALAFADLGTIRWLGLVQALRSQGASRAALAVMARVLLPGWASFGACVALVIGTRSSQEVASFLLITWVVACLGWDMILVWQAQLWLLPGIRVRSEP